MSTGQPHRHANGPLSELSAAVNTAAAAVRGSAGPPSAQPTLDRPRHRGQGDYSTNAAMLLAPVLGSPPREIAERLGSELTGMLGDELERVEVAGPGFLNLVLSDHWHQRALRSVVDAGERFGAGGADPAERISVEFVSANPTGPLVAASGRHAAYGDALARILQHYGHSVEREYYFNDAGNQIRLLGESVQARARGVDVPEGGYQGSYVADLAAVIPGAANAGVDEVAGAAVDILLAQIKATLDRYGVVFDVYFSERTLHEGWPSPLQRALTRLEEVGHVYHSDGALWLRTTSFGDDKDRVVIRSNGEPTYLAADIAYMENKRERGFDRQLVPVGSDHSAYVRAMKAAMEALGGDPDTVELPLLQFVHLVEGGEVSAMSKRRGDFVMLDELLDEIGVDATRFFMLQRSNDRTIELDLDLARKQSRENPVYYIQYAHARIASMLRRLPADRVAGALATDWDSVSLEDPERDLIKKLVAFPGEIAEAVERRAPHRIAGYALELAQDFTTFYEACHVVGATPEAVESFRVALSFAAQSTIALSLGLLGVSAPDAM
ncbi:MAG TPA: arginine--tRNA ligase [Solirubrobacteraceae bacterium]|jgi:arginyl-tRNA synthetase|nr:arginine--tRNA ligase [Solirubrobacteraceae bacterium]